MKIQLDDFKTANAELVDQLDKSQKNVSKMKSKVSKYLKFETYWIRAHIIHLTEIGLYAYHCQLSFIDYFVSDLSEISHFRWRRLLNLKALLATKRTK